MSAVLHVMSYRAGEAARFVARMHRVHRRLDRTPGVIAGRLFATASFWAPTSGYPTLRRYALLCAFEDEPAQARFESSPLAASLFDPAREHWRVALAPVGSPTGQWRGWKPGGADTTPLGQDEPMAVLTYGVLHPRHIHRFAVANRRVIAASMDQPGLVMRITLFDRLLSICTFSIWRRKGDALRFAYGADGLHHEVIKPWREAWGSQDFFVRFRVLDSSGIYAGEDLGALLEDDQSGVTMHRRQVNQQLGRALDDEPKDHE